MIEKLVSVIIPIYNAERYILRCVNSVIKQSYRNIEIILINDGSTDNSQELCNSLLNCDRRIRVINKENGGVHTARNEGIKIAHGEYITFIDSDDWINEDYILELIKNMEEKKADLIICNYQDVYIKGNKEKYIANDNGEDRYISICNSVDKIFFTNGLINPCWGKLYKKQIIKKYNLSFKSLKLSEDTLFNLEYLGYCKNIFINSKSLYFYVHYENNNNLTNRVYVNIFKDYLQVHKQYLEFIDIYNNGEKIRDTVNQTMYFQYYSALVKILNANSIKYNEKKRILDLALENKLIIDTFYVKQQSKIMNIINKLIIDKKYFLLKVIYFYLYNIRGSEGEYSD